MNDTNNPKAQGDKQDSACACACLYQYYAGKLYAYA